MALMDKIRTMLQERADITLIDPAATDNPAIRGIQLRRSWCLTILNPDGFSPVERQHWHYYGQFFHIEEPRFTKKKGMVAEQRDLAAHIGRVGGLIIFPTTIDDVIDYLGPEPENIQDYLARREK